MKEYWVRAANWKQAGSKGEKLGDKLFRKGDVLYRRDVIVEKVELAGSVDA